ncbi:MAG: DUF4389 domain-containing protein [Spirochaetota bacterium]
MQYSVKYQDKYSRGQLLLRTIFGGFYIALPHFFLMAFVGIWAAILSFLAAWVVLFTGKYPKGWFDFQVKFGAWGARLTASMMNFMDEYPAFGTGGTSASVTYSVNYPASLSRGLLILRVLFGVFYVYVPHMFCLYFRLIWSSLLMFLAWWAILFTGKYPKGFFEFNVGTMRWLNNVSVYMSLLTDEYPKFSGKE